MRIEDARMLLVFPVGLAIGWVLASMEIRILAHYGKEPPIRRLFRWMKGQQEEKP